MPAPLRLATLIHSAACFAKTVDAQDSLGTLNQWQQEWSAAIVEATAAEALQSTSLPEPGRAAAFLDCEPMDDGDRFWPTFRAVYEEFGPFGTFTMQLAVGKWQEWEDLVSEMHEAGFFDGHHSMPLPGSFLGNGRVEETLIHDRQDMLLAFQRAQYHALFASPPKWGPDVLVGILSCPIGFLFAQYVVFLVQKVRSKLDHEDAKINWESMVKTYASLLGTPSYVMDHLESSHWGLTSFDIAVNLNMESGTHYTSYEDYCTRRPIPSPTFLSWYEDWPEHSKWLDMPLVQILRESSIIADRGGKVRIALIGEHAPSNLEHLSALTAALHDACDKSDCVGDAQEAFPKLEAAHFFTYLWALEGTAEGSAVDSSLRMTWEAFWGSHLTASKGRDSSETPRWTIDRAVWVLREFAEREPFLSRAQIFVCSEPLWLCVLLHAARGATGLLTRASSAGRVMCLLVDFYQVFGKDQVVEYWPLVQAFAASGSPRGSISATSRMTAEMLAFQAGVHVPYVPFLALHLAASAPYRPTSAQVLMFRSSLPAMPAFARLLQLLAVETPSAPQIVHMKGTLSYSEIAQFRAVVLLPHIPSPLRLAEIYAMGSPALVPAAPFIHKFVWPRDPLPPSEELVNWQAPNRSTPPFSPVEFQRDLFGFHRHHDERRYWLQFTEWELRPHLIRFTSARDLLEKASISEDEGRAVSAQMQEAHRKLKTEALAYWQVAVLAAMDTSS